MKKTNSKPPLTKQKSSVKTTLTPVSSTLFDIDFVTEELSSEEKETLKTCCKIVSNNRIVFSVVHDSIRIFPVDELMKLKSIKGKFDVNISFLTSEKIKIGTLVYKACNMDVDFNDFMCFHKMTNDFGIDFGKEKEITVGLCPESILYNNKAI